MNTIFRRLIARTSVVHSVPGRIRLHVPVIARILLGTDLEAITGFAVTAFTGVTGMTISMVTNGADRYAARP